MNNLREERFRRVATVRTAKSIAMLRLLGNCSDPRIYAFTPEEAQALLQQVEAALEDVKERFANPSPIKDGNLHWEKGMTKNDCKNSA